MSTVTSPSCWCQAEGAEPHASSCPLHAARVEAGAAQPPLGLQPYSPLEHIKTDAELEEYVQARIQLAAGVATVDPVAWRVRGYNQFKTGEPRPWRYFDGADKPKVNNPDDCDMEPLFAAGVKACDGIQTE